MEHNTTINLHAGPKGKLFFSTLMYVCFCQPIFMFVRCPFIHHRSKFDMAFCVTRRSSNCTSQNIKHILPLTGEQSGRMCLIRFLTERIWWKKSKAASRIMFWSTTKWISKYAIKHKYRLRSYLLMWRNKVHCLVTLHPTSALWTEMKRKTNLVTKTIYNRFSQCSPTYCWFKCKVETTPHTKSFLFIVINVPLFTDWDKNGQFSQIHKFQQMLIGTLRTKFSWKHSFRNLSIQFVILAVLIQRNKFTWGVKELLQLRWHAIN